MSALVRDEWVGGIDGPNAHPSLHRPSTPTSAPVAPFPCMPTPTQADILMVTDGEIPQPSETILGTIKSMHDTK